MTTRKNSIITDYLFESKYPGGTYSSLLPDDNTKEHLYAHCVELGIPDIVDPEEYHCTLIYSKHGCPEISRENFNLPCKALPIGYKILGTDKKVLVLELYCPNAVNLHNLFMEKHGATHDYEEYIPHVTIANNFEGDLPVNLPDMELIFNGRTIEVLE